MLKFNFDVFLSHNSKDKHLVEQVAEKLKFFGLRPWFDKWCLRPGAIWQDELAAGLSESSACAVFIGGNGLGDWAREELGVALMRAAKERTFRLFLVLLPGLPEPFDATTLPPFLSTRTWVDMRKGIDSTCAIQVLVDVVKGGTHATSYTGEQSENICPYRGLQFFDEEHSRFFRGRESEIQRLVEKIKNNRLLTVVGPSGSGKSSLVRAGVIPAIRKGALPGSQTWTIHTFTPGNHPLTTLSAFLLRIFPQEAMQKTVDQLSSDERSLHLGIALALAGRPDTERVVWIIDQLEELFTLCRDEIERKQFLQNLLYASSIPGGRNIVIMTMRADFYSKFAEYSTFSAYVAAQQFLISTIDANGLQHVISDPAHSVGLTFEDGLIETILENVTNQPGALPLLEHTLLELWNRRKGNVLTIEAYWDSGGVNGAISNRADTIFMALSPKQQVVMKQIMLRLTQPGEGTEDTRRRALISELLTKPNEKNEIDVVIHSMVEARLFVVSTDVLSNEPVVEVAHEALIRAWPRLIQWIDANRRNLLIHRRLTEAACEWRRLNFDTSVLYRRAKLVEVQEWINDNSITMNEQETDFVKQSNKYSKKERRLKYLYYTIPVFIIMIFFQSLSMITTISKRIELNIMLSETSRKANEAENKVKKTIVEQAQFEHLQKEANYYKKEVQKMRTKRRVYDKDSFKRSVVLN